MGWKNTYRDLLLYIPYNYVGKGFSYYYVVVQIYTIDLNHIKSHRGSPKDISSLIKK